MEAELGRFSAVYSLTNAEKAKVMNWFRNLSIASYQNALQVFNDNFRVADTARWPLTGLRTAHALLTHPGPDDELTIILSLIEAIVSSELVYVLRLDSMVQAVDTSLSFEER